MIIRVNPVNLILNCDPNYIQIKVVVIVTFISDIFVIHIAVNGSIDHFKTKASRVVKIQKIG